MTGGAGSGHDGHRFGRSDLVGVLRGNRFDRSVGLLGRRFVFFGSAGIRREIGLVLASRGFSDRDFGFDGWSLVNRGGGNGRLGDRRGARGLGVCRRVDQDL